MKESKKVYISLICILGSASTVCSDFSDIFSNLAEQFKNIPASGTGTYIQQSPGISTEKTTTIQTKEQSGGQQPPERTVTEVSTEKVHMFDPTTNITK